MTETGDDVLRALSAYLRAQVRQEDLAFRYGGEEFLLILPCATFDGVTSRIDRLCKQFKEVNLGRLHEALWPVTLSIGVARFPDHGDCRRVTTQCA